MLLNVLRLSQDYGRHSRIKLLQTILGCSKPGFKESLHGTRYLGNDVRFAFRFAQPCGFAPKKTNSMDSPRRCLTFLSDNSDDGFLDLLGDGDEENAQLPSQLPSQLTSPLPSGFGSLMAGAIVTESPSPIKRPFKRCTPDVATPQRKRTVSFLEQVSTWFRWLIDL